MTRGNRTVLLAYVLLVEVLVLVDRLGADSVFFVIILVTLPAGLLFYPVLFVLWGVQLSAGMPDSPYVAAPLLAVVAAATAMGNFLFLRLMGDEARGCCAVPAAPSRPARVAGS